MQVLLADDQAVIRMGLRAMLEEAGHEVVGTATNGKGAVALAETTKPDLIILDIRMPEMDGLEAARRIMAKRPTPIVMLTAYSQRDYIEQAKAAPVFAYLVKPLKEALLTPTLELALARFKEWQKLRKEAADLRESLETRDLVEQAKRLLIENEALTEQQAFLKIHRQSRNRRVTMRLVAEEIIAAYGA
jgi:response regulator NasT